MMAEDLSAFFDPDEFAVQALLDGVAVLGNLNAASVVDEGDVTTIAPTFLLATSNATGAVGKQLVVGATTYKVRDAQLKGTGALTELLLARV